MTRVTLTLATLVLLGVATDLPSAQGGAPTSASVVFSSGQAGTVWSGNLHAVSHPYYRGHRGGYGGYGGYHGGYGGYGGYGAYFGGYPRMPVPSPFWTSPTVVVPYVAAPTVAYPSVYGAPGCYYAPNRFQYYGPRFSFGVSF